MQDFFDRDEDFEELEPREDSLDKALGSAVFGSLSISPTDWTIETLHRQIGRTIELNPDFQRRNVWSAKAKTSFIESLFLGVPIPQILLSAKEGSNKSFLVLDGKQRLLTIKEFLDGRFPDGKPFVLKNLRVLEELENLSWLDIKGSTDWEFELLNRTQRTAVIRGWSDERVLYEIFHRLNSGSVRLSPMELRMSLHPGPFLKFAVNWTENVGPLHHLLSKTSPDPRMNDVELVVRFLGFSSRKVPYSGDLKSFLDRTCVSLNQEFDSSLNARVAQCEEILDKMNRAIKLGREIFGSKRFCRKFTEEGYESRFNRAVFDVVVGALSKPDIYEWAEQNGKSFRLGFEEISLNEDFRRSVESTTKSLSATRTRFSLFYKKISLLSRLPIELPLLSDEPSN
ncbi:DUF262 domain-containing protein [Ruegeria pomeroyi]|uniref:DUF262 domain-containing protein n=1 Tax=Ruegeria pomeroyi TaxID=89184 RepID=A0A9Q3WJ26_9RHOB|nr:DUF262 domain-containing protein [Ruegeria pomeroyi]MCE8536778.1 DUF262 domain-containing protein [Ruegeria pomeroyi]